MKMPPKLARWPAKASVLLALHVILAAAAAAPQGRQVTVTVLATTDLHGYLYPVDYYTGQPSARGLAKIASLIRAVQRESPNTLLVDCGDTIQGSPLESVYQHYAATGRLPGRLAFAGEPLRGDPMMLAMNRLGYHAMILGNHEFNFGLANLNKARSDARFPWISANTVLTPGSKARPFDPWLLKTVAGVRVAIVGLTTPVIPSLEKPENYTGYRFLSLKETLVSALRDLRRRRPDLVIAAVHAGLDRDPRSNAPRRVGKPGENVASELAADVGGIDAILFGHTHQHLNERSAGDVLLVQPKNWGMSLARLDFVLERRSRGAWQVSAKRSRLLPVSKYVEADPDILRLARPYHEVTERYLNTPVAEAPAAMDGRLGRVQDTAIVDAIHCVQLSYARADVSLTALFNPRVRIPKGPVTVRQIAALYTYDNELYAVEGTGRMLKEALENAARYYRSCPDPSCSHGPLINRRVAGFNYDMAAGVEYEIDLTKPEGQRIVNLRWKGKPLDPKQKLRIALNSYRAAGSAGYSMFRGAKILWRSRADIRDLIVEYYTMRRKLPARPDGNWRIVPPEARQLLEKEMREEDGTGDF